MADEKQIKQALTVLNNIAKALDSKGVKYKLEAEKLLIQTGTQGDDLPIPLIIRVNPDMQIVTLLSLLPFSVEKDQRVATAVAVSGINNRLVDGSFDYDIKSGQIGFRLTTYYRESLISGEVFLYMLYVSCQTIDAYNDKFLMLSKGVLTLEELLTGKK